MVLELCSVVGQLDVALHAAEKSGWNMLSIGAAAAVFHCAQTATAALTNQVFELHVGRLDSFDQRIHRQAGSIAAEEIPLGPVREHGLHSHSHRERGVDYWGRDVRHSFELAHD